MKANPSLGIPAKTVFDAIRARRGSQARRTIARSVILSSPAERDLNDIYQWIVTRAGATTALAYIARRERYILKLDIAFVVEDRQVTVLRIFRRGRNWSRKALFRAMDRGDRQWSRPSGTARSSRNPTTP